MCNLSLNLIEEGFEKGFKEGFEEGFKEEMIRCTKCVMTNLSLSFEQAIQALGIPEEEVEEYRTALTNK